MIHVTHMVLYCYFPLIGFFGLEGFHYIVYFLSVDYQSFPYLYNTLLS